MIEKEAWNTENENGLQGSTRTRIAVGKPGSDNIRQYYYTESHAQHPLIEILNRIELSKRRFKINQLVLRIELLRERKKREIEIEIEIERGNDVGGTKMEQISKAHLESARIWKWCRFNSHRSL